MFSFLGGSLLTDGSERNNPLESFVGLAVMTSARSINPVSAIGGALFVDGILHHRPAETGIGLGIGIIGAVGEAMTSNNNSSRHHPTPSYTNTYRYRKETNAEKDERIKRQIANNVRIYLEEENQETIRIAIFKRHLALIELSQQFEYDELHKKINELSPLIQPALRFRDSHYIGIPEINESNLFHSILCNNKFTGNNKTTLLQTLINKKQYDPSYLLESPCFNLFLNDPTFYVNNASLKNIYLHTIGKHNSLPTHQTIWKKLLDNSSAEDTEDLFDALLNKSSGSPTEQAKRAIHYLKLWLQSKTTSADIISTWHKIQKIITASKISSFKDSFHKLAKQRVLELELQDDKKDIPHTPNFGQTRIKVTFLNTHRHSIFTCLRTKSKKIYDGINTNRPLALKHYNEEQLSIDRELENKLSLLRF